MTAGQDYIVIQCIISMIVAAQVTLCAVNMHTAIIRTTTLKIMCVVHIIVKPCT